MGAAGKDCTFYFSQSRFPAFIAPPVTVTYCKCVTHDYAANVPDSCFSSHVNESWSASHTDSFAQTEKALGIHLIRGWLDLTASLKTL
jgi:hypothetical protein